MQAARCAGATIRGVIELLEWVAARPRTYSEGIEAWRTSCPRYIPWDDALTLGLIRVERGGAESTIRLTPSGEALLASSRDDKARRPDATTALESTGLF